MQDSFRRVIAKLGKEYRRAREQLVEGWQELRLRSGGALTRFHRSRERGQTIPGQPPLQWAMLAAEVWETAHAVIVRIEVPGLDKHSLDVSIAPGRLHIRGERRALRGTARLHFHLSERAFGRFERTIALPPGIDAVKAEVECRDGVLSAIVPKTDAIPPRYPPRRGA